MRICRQHFIVIFYRQHFKKEEKGIRFNIFIKPKKGSIPKLQILETRRTLGDHVLMFDYIKKTITDIEANNDPQHSKYCKYQMLFP